jgi:hypothetical protein
VSSVSAYAGSAGSNFFSAGSTAWSSVSNYTGAPNGAFALSGMTSGVESESLDGYNFNPGLPTGATVTGIEIIVTATKTNATRAITFAGNELQIGGVTGTPTTTNSNGTALTTSTATYQFGSSTDLWGFSSGTLTAANINSATESNCVWGCWFSGGASSSQAECDSVQITIYYTAAVVIQQMLGLLGVGS